MPSVTRRSIESGARATTLVDLLRGRAARDGAWTAFTFLTDGEDRPVSLSYADLDRQARAIAAMLCEYGGRGQRALLLFPPGLDYLAGFFGCIYAATTAVPVYPPDPTRLERTLPRLLAIIASSEPTFVLTISPIREMVEQLFPRMPELARLRWIDVDALPGGAEVGWQDPGVAPGDLAFLQYTSGSTATPRGVMLTHRNLLHNLSLMQRAVAATPDKTVVLWLPPYHDMGLIGGILAPLYSGCHSVLMSPLAFLQRPQRWLEAISRHPRVIGGGPNFAFDLCVRKTSPDERSRLDLSNWQVAFSGAEPVRPETLERFASAFEPSGFKREVFLPCYGLAEATLLVTGKAPGKPPTLRSFSAGALSRGAVAPPTGPADARTLPSCGRPPDEQEVRIVDPATLHPCGPGQMGEIWVSGPSVATGYYGLPEETERIFHARTSGGGRYLRTGDLGFIDHGELFVAGRIKDLIILHGRNLYPQDLELSVEACHPALRPGCTAAFSVDLDGEERLVVACEVEAAVAAAVERGDAGIAEQVGRQVRKALFEEHACEPHTVLLLKPRTVPKTSSGKIQRRACRQGFLEGSLELLGAWRSGETAPVEYLAPRDEIEAKLAALFADVLGAGEVGVHDSFFARGGHSLSAADLVARVQDAFGVKVPLAKLFESATVAELAEVVRRGSSARLGSGDSPLPAVIPAPTRRHEPFPLTDLQQAYWLGRSGGLTPGGVATHAYVEFDVQELDLQRFERAWQHLVNRHEMLRTVIRPDGQQQVLEEVPAYAVETIDLRFEPETEAERRLAAIRESLSHQVLDPQRWPLFELRASLLPHRTRLHVSLDLLIADLGSTEILLRELHALYHHPDVSLPHLELSFRDYLRAERELETSASMQRAREYWMGRLADLPEGPALPLARSPDSVRTPRFVRRSMRLDRDAWALLRGRAAHAGVTPSTALLTAYAEVLGTWSKAPRFTLAVTTFGRLPLHPQVNEIIGDFTSLALLEVDHSVPGEFSARARALQRRLWEALDHGLFNGVRVLRERMRLRGPALIPVVFTSAPAVGDGRPSQARAWLGDPVWAISQTSQIWLDHQVHEVDGAIDLVWDAVEDLFPAGMLDDMFSAYLSLVQRLATEDQIWRGPLAGLVPGEQLERRRAVNATAAPAPTELLHSRFFEHAAQHPDRIAIVDASRRLTYRELAAVAMRLGRELRRQGATPDALVGVVMEKGWEQVAAVLGVLASGAAYLPIEASLPEERRFQLLQQGEVRLILTQPRLVEALRWPPGVQVLAVHGAGDEHSSPTAFSEGSNLAYVIFTSGSTGQPKGVAIEHRSAMNTVLDINQRLGVGADDRAIALSSLGFDLSVWDIFGPLSAGGAVILPEGEGLRDPGHWLELLERERVTVWNSVPALVEMLVSHVTGLGRRLPDSLRWVLMSGDWIPVSLPARLSALCAAEQVSLGGATEASIWSISFPIARVDPSWPSIPYGTPLRNQTFHVLDHRLEPRPIWVPGELYIGGMGLARGYWRDPERTRECFITHPRSGERLYRTGDFGRYLPDGNLELLGREDLQVKLRGYRIELGEVEATLLGYPGVRAAVVNPVGSSPETRRLVAYVVPGALPPPDEEELRAFVSRKLPPYMVPSIFTFMDHLPLSANGKVDRRALLAPSARTRTRAADVLPLTPAGAALAKLFAEVLGLQEVGPDDNFFQLGGTSIQASHLALRIRETLRPDFLIQTMFSHPTVAELERALEQGNSERPLHLEAEATLEPGIVPPTTPARRARARLFLTGATGFLGSYLLRELLARTSSQIFCLVRSRSPEDALARVRSPLAARHLWRREYEGRVVPVLGDLQRPCFGMEDSRFAELASLVDEVYLCGAQVNFVLPYECLARANVGGTRAAIRLACQGRAKAIHYVSTMGVFLTQAAFPLEDVTERSSLPDGAAIVGGYAQSKWAAERLIQSAGARGLPVRIYRPTIILPRSTSGARHEHDTFTMLLEGSVAIGAVPELDLEVDLVPVDFVASAIAALSLAEAPEGPFHLSSPRAVHLKEIATQLRKRGKPTRVVPLAEWLTAFFQYARGAVDRPVHGLAPAFVEQIGDRTIMQALAEALDKLRFCSPHTRMALEKLGVHCPSSSALLDDYLGPFERNRGIPRQGTVGSNAI